MKIPFTNISIFNKNQEVSTPEKAKLFSDYSGSIKQNIIRVRTTMSEYKTAILIAENRQNPQRYNIYQIYNNIINDAHLQAVISQRNNLSLSKKYRVLDANGEVNEEKTKLLKRKWFRDWLKHCLDSQDWGHSLVQFGDIVNNEFSEVELVPRHYVRPDYQLHYVVNYWGDITGKDYLDTPYKEWCRSIGRKNDLGLLMKAAPLVIWKQFAMGCWADYQSKFGMPMRYYKTDHYDEGTRTKAENLMKNWDIGQYTIIGKEDELGLLESGLSDSYMVFQEMIKLINGEISKLFLNQTMTTDDGSSRSQAEVHERILLGVEQNQDAFIDYCNNDELVPLMIEKGMLSEGDRIEEEEGEKLTTIERSKIDIELLKSGKFTMTPEYIKETYGSDVIPVTEPDGDEALKGFKNRMTNYYG